MTQNSFSATNPLRSASSDLIVDRSVRHFNQIDLSRRWNISPRTLERWRWLKQGPPYLKIGGRVVYRLEDVIGFEERRLHDAERA